MKQDSSATPADGTEPIVPAASDSNSKGDFKHNWLWGQIPLLALIILCAIATLLSDRFLSPININNILMQGAVITVVAIGMTFVIIGGGFDLSVGSTVAISGIVSTYVMLETNILFGVTAGIGIGALVGVVNGLVVTKLDVNPFIATLGTMVLVRGLAFVITDGQPVVGDEGLPELFNAFCPGTIPGGTVLGMAADFRADRL